MTTLEFRLYRDERIRDLSRAYEDDPDKTSDDPAVRSAWERVRRNWQDHAETVKAYAYEENIDELMQAWHSVSSENRFRNEHEGIALNPKLSREQIAEILSVAEGNPNMYWVVHHLQQHPNK